MLRVGLKDVPFFMVRNDSDGATLSGNDRFYGFNVDVIRALSAMLKFRYELYVVDEEQSTRQTITVSDSVVQQLLQGVSISGSGNFLYNGNWTTQCKPNV